MCIPQGSSLGPLLLLCTRAESKNASSFLFFFRRVTFVQPRTQAHFTADDVIISLAAAPKFVSCACACGLNDHREERGESLLTFCPLTSVLCSLTSRGESLLFWKIGCIV